MAGTNLYQQQSLARKVVYAVLILILLSVALGIRILNVGPFRGIQAQANDLGLREEDLGEVELMGSAVRLTLTGSRGLVVCILWGEAIEKQKRHEWNELERYVDTLTKLQPHFTTPWLFQSWNLAYNVSVEMDSPKDKYFYIARGLELIAEGDRRNRGNPDLRFNAGIYYQNKFGVSDESNTLRSLLQMSCIDPLKRHVYAAGLRERETGQVDRRAFDEFAKLHPSLIRRLHSKLNLETPADIVDFLEQNWSIPSRYLMPDPKALLARTHTVSALKRPEEQFPILAGFDPKLPAYRHEYTPDLDELPDEFDNFMAARGWFLYSQETLPEPDPEPRQFTKPHDPRKYRMPKSPTILIFRHYPARSQAYYAESLEKDGWFDEPWDLTSAFPRSAADGATGPVTVGQGRAQDAWQKAHEMYLQHGRENGLYFDPIVLENMQDRARRYQLAAGVGPNDLPPTGEQLPAPLRGRGLDDAYKAHYQLYWLRRNQDMTNFEHFLTQTRVESTKEAVLARRNFYEAERLRKAARAPEEIVKVFDRPEAFPAWKRILTQYPDYRRDSIVQEDTCELNYKYMKVSQEILKSQAKGLVDDLLLLGRTLENPATPWLIPDKLVKLPPARARNAVLLAPVVTGPFDGDDENGVPWLKPDTVFRVYARFGINRPSPTPVEGTPPAPAQPQPRSDTP